jgi:hypothetical protein
MKLSFLTRCSALVVAAAVAAACTMKKQERPDLSGPSEFATSITISVTPDVIQQDGASQSVITVTARGPNGQPLTSLPLRAEIQVNGVPTDFGSLSARNIVTGADGRATLVFTAPAAPATPIAVDTLTVVDIGITPLGTDFTNSSTRFASIRLVPRGIIVPPANLRPQFTFTPSGPQDHQSVLFDASGSTAPANNPIATFSWNFGDGDSGSGQTTTHSFDSPGTFVVTLTVADSLGRLASTSQSINVSQGTTPTAAFAISPTPGTVGRAVNVNAAASKAAPGRTIVTYTWDFGDGTPLLNGQQQSHTYTRPGTYSITLTVTDDAGRTATLSQTLTVT